MTEAEFLGFEGFKVKSKGKSRFLVRHGGLGMTKHPVSEYGIHREWESAVTKGWRLKFVLIPGIRTLRY